jgi:hypothetical protein
LDARGQYFDDGYVEDEAEDKSPGFFENLMSGGKLQREYDKAQQKKRESS